MNATTTAVGASAKTAAELDRTEKVLRLIWVVVIGAVLFSLVTSVPLVQHVTPKSWQWTAYFLSMIVDTAVIIVVQVGAAVSSLGETPGGWFSLLRWMTGIYTLFLNIGWSILTKDITGVLVHAIIPTLLIVCTSAEIRVRQRIAKARAVAYERSERERVNAAREARERADRERRERQEREARERQEREARERRDAQEKADRERAERQAEAQRAEREHAQRMAEADRLAAIEREKIAATERQAEADRLAALEKEKIAAQEKAAEADRRVRTEREERERAENAEADRRAHELRIEQEKSAVAIERERLAHQAEQAELQRKHELAVARANARAGRSPERSEDRSRERSTSVHESVHGDRSRDGERLSEEDAIRVIANTPAASVRNLAQITGWSLGWVSNQRRAVSSTVNGSHSDEEDE